jgi:hypothetical protein
MKDTVLLTSNPTCPLLVYGEAVGFYKLSLYNYNFALSLISFRSFFVGGDSQIFYIDNYVICECTILVLPSQSLSLYIYIFWQYCGFNSGQLLCNISHTPTTFLLQLFFR